MFQKCEKCRIEEKKYICLNLECLQQNKSFQLECVDCLQKQHKLNFQSHELQNITKISQIAMEKKKNLNIYLNSLKNRYQDLRNDNEQQLILLKNKIITYIDNQIDHYKQEFAHSYCQIDEIISNLTNQTRDKQLKIEELLFLIKLDLEEYKQQSDTTILNIKEEVQNKYYELTNQISFINQPQQIVFPLIQNLSFKYEIPHNPQIKIEQCQIHKQQQSAFCAHPNCLKDNQILIQCLCNSKHKQHSEYFITLESEQEIINKIKQWKQQNIIINKKIKNEINQQLIKLQEIENNQKQSIQLIRTKLKILKDQSQQNVNDPKFLGKQIIGGIYQNVVSNFTQKLKNEQTKQSLDFKIGLEQINEILKEKLQLKNETEIEDQPTSKNSSIKILSIGKLNDDINQQEKKLNSVKKIPFYNKQDELSQNRLKHSQSIYEFPNKPQKTLPELDVNYSNGLSSCRNSQQQNIQDNNNNFQYLKQNRLSHITKQNFIDPKQNNK